MSSCKNNQGINQPNIRKKILQMYSNSFKDQLIIYGCEILQK